MDVRSQSDVIDYMVVCTGTSNRHVKSLASHLVQQAKTAQFSFIQTEGMDDAEWVLVDLGSTVVHIMQSEMRDYYQIERLWQPFADKAFNPSP